MSRNKQTGESGGLVISIIPPHQKQSLHAADRVMYWANYIADRLPPIQGAALRRYAQREATAKA